MNANLVARYLLRYLVQLATIHSAKEEPHVFIFSTRRSGSTLLRDMIASQPGFNYIDQPFDFTKNQINPYRKWFPRLKYGQITSLTPEEAAIAKHYLEGLLTRKYVLRSQWRFWSRNYHWIWWRYVVKELSTKPVMPWFDAIWRKQARIVYLVRHPLAVSYSIVSQAWDFTHVAFLQDPHFVDSHLTANLVQLAERIKNCGTVFERHVLDWCLENVVPLRCWETTNWTLVSYERMVTEPEITVCRLCRDLDLPEPDRMQSVIVHPTRSTTRESRKHIQALGPQSRIADWQKGIPSDALKSAARILDAFEIDIYDAYSPVAREAFDRHLDTPVQAPAMGISNVIPEHLEIE